MGLNQLACACLRVISIHGSRLIWTRALPSHWMTRIDPNAQILQRVFFFNFQRSTEYRITLMS